MDKEVGLEEVVVAMAGVAMEVVVVAEVPALDQEATRREDQRPIAIRAPFEGETQAGGERTSFLPRTTKDYFKLHPVPQCWPWAMDTTSDSSPAGKVSSRRTDEALERLASGDR